VYLQEDSEPLNFDDLFSVPAAAKPSSVQTFPAAKLSSKMSVKSASKQWQETHFRNVNHSIYFSSIFTVFVF